MFGRSLEEKAVERGLDYQNNDNYEKAEQEFKKAVKINPNYSDAYYYLGVLYKIQGKSDAAIASYEKALDVDPNNSRARYMLKLLTDTEAVLAPTNTPPPVALARETDFKEKQVDRDQIKKELMNDIKETYENALQLAKEENYGEAIVQFEKSVKLNPANIKARYNLAVAYLKTGHPVKATAQLRQVLKINPQYQPAKAGLNKIMGKDN